MSDQSGRRIVQPAPATIDCHLPQDTADDALLRIGDAEIAFDPSSREARTQTLEALAKIRRCVDELEAHVRVIRIAPEHATTSN